MLNLTTLYSRYKVFNPENMRTLYVMLALFIGLTGIAFSVVIYIKLDIFNDNYIVLSFMFLSLVYLHIGVNIYCKFNINILIINLRNNYEYIVKSFYLVLTILIKDWKVNWITKLKRILLYRTLHSGVLILFILCNIKFTLQLYVALILLVILSIWVYNYNIIKHKLNNIYTKGNIKDLITCFMIWVILWIIIVIIIGYLLSSIYFLFFCLLPCIPLSFMDSFLDGYILMEGPANQGGGSNPGDGGPSNPNNPGGPPSSNNQAMIANPDDNDRYGQYYEGPGAVFPRPRREILTPMRYLGYNLDGPSFPNAPRPGNTLSYGYFHDRYGSTHLFTMDCTPGSPAYPYNMEYDTANQPWRARRVTMYTPLPHRHFNTYCDMHPLYPGVVVENTTWNIFQIHFEMHRWYGRFSTPLTDAEINDFSGMMYRNLFESNQHVPPIYKYTLTYGMHGAHVWAKWRCSLCGVFRTPDASRWLP